MQIPDEKPIVFDVDEDAEPAAAKGARPSSVIEILHPLAGPAQPAEPDEPSETDAPPPAVETEGLPAAASARSGGRRALLTLAALAAIALTFVSGIYLGRYWPPPTPAESPTATAENLSADVGGPTDVSEDRQPDSALADQDRLYQFDTPPDKETPAASPAVRPVKTRVKRRYKKTRRAFAAFRRPRPPVHSQFWVSDFTPTTLIIYVESGEVKTRIEPQTAPRYKKPSSLSN